jgi:hypothetical protein
MCFVILLSRFLCVVANRTVSLFFQAHVYNHAFCIHSCDHRHLGSFHILTPVNSAAVNKAVGIPYCDPNVNTCVAITESGTDSWIK